MNGTEIKARLLSYSIVTDDEYLNKYVDIVLSNTDTLSVRHKTQKHHIIPRALFLHNKEPIDNSSSNIVNLSYQNHIMAHYYLFKCATGWFKYSASKAVDYLVKRIDSIKSKPNMFTKIEFNLSEDELNALLPDLVNIQEQAKIGESRRLAGGKWIHKDGCQQYAAPADLPNLLQDGWLIGKLVKNPLVAAENAERRRRAVAHRGEKYHMYNNGVEQKNFYESETIPVGWHRGMLDKNKIKYGAHNVGRTPWNKGLTKETDERVAAYCANNSSIWRKGNIPWNAGKHFSEESRKKMSISAKNRRDRCNLDENI